MRNLSLIILCAISLGFVGCQTNSKNQQKAGNMKGPNGKTNVATEQASGKKPEMDGHNANKDNSEAPDQKQEIGMVSCKLDKEEKATRSVNFKQELYPYLKAIEEVSGGYAMKFEGKKHVIKGIHEYLLGEWECCPFFTFEMKYEAQQGPVWVKFKGGEQVKAMIEANWDQLLPDDSPIRP